MENIDMKAVALRGLELVLFVAALAFAVPNAVVASDYPTGFDMNLTSAISRMSYRNGRTTRDLVEPDRIYTLTIEPFRAASFPVIRDLKVDRGAFDRIIEAGGFVSTNVATAPEATTRGSAARPRLGSGRCLPAGAGRSRGAAAPRRKTESVRCS